MNKIKFFLVVLVILLTACRTTAAARQPQRIVSLGPALTEELSLLGLTDRLVGVTTYCIVPGAGEDIVRVGTVTDIDLERVVALNPDLVLATALTNVRQREGLRRLGIPVIVFPYYKSYQQICDEFIHLGEITGEKEKAERLIARLQNRVTAIAELTEQLPRPKVFLQVGSEPLFTVSRDSFVNDFIVLAGGSNIAAESGIGMYSMEEVVRQNPDVIIITAMGIAGQQEKEKWQRFNSISAVKQNRIYIIDPYKIGSPTPESFIATLEDVVVLLHPELITEK